MQIKYLKQLESVDQVGNIAPREPMTLDEITSLEEKFNSSNEFPIAFREYLFLAGKWGGTGVIDDDFEEIREECDEDLEYTGYTLERPFFVFDKLDGQYSIFFLDEDKEDPDVYILYPSGAYEGHEPLLRDVKYTFSKMINDSIYRAKNNIPL